MEASPQVSRELLKHHDVPGTDLERRLYQTGQSFQDIAVTPHTLFRNLDTEAPLKVLICYTIIKSDMASITP